MFYGQCYKCGERWELGTASTCKCPDFWEGYVPEPVKPAQQLVDCHATGVCVQSGLRAEQPAQRKPLTDEQIDAEFDAFASKFDHESNEWLDMGVDAYFRAGFKAAHGIGEKK